MKNVSIRVAASALAVTALMLSSCILPGDDPSEAYAENVDLRSGRLALDTTFAADRVAYVDDWLYVGDGVTLTIEPGAVVKFGAGGGITFESGARVVANGTETKPIVFTSIKDDSAGGDSLLDGPKVPSAGNWRYLWIESGTANASFSHCSFSYGGADSSAALYLGAEAQVSYCDFHDNGGGTPWVDDDGAVLHVAAWSPSTTVDHCRFWNNRWPLSIPPNMSLGDTNTFRVDHDGDGATPPAGNTYQAIGVDLGGGQNLGIDTQWLETEAAFVIHGNILYVGDLEDAHDLELGSGVVVKFVDADSGLYVYKNSTLVTAGDTILTSIADDLALGDTNADGASTAPADGDWDGVYDGNLGGGTGGYIQNGSLVRYSIRTP